MKRLVASLALAASLVASMEPASAQTSRFKGWAAISKELSTRIAPRDAPLDLDRFLPAEDMEDLLGTWSTFGTEHNFKNGLPNPVNVAIWHVALSGFAQSVAGSCDKAQLQFHPRFSAILAKLCTWPAAEARSEAVLLDYWWSIMGHNAPEEEFVAWRDFITGTYQGRPAHETIADMTLAIAMNPYFLLDK